MNTTQKQRMMWLGGFLLVAFYFAPTIIHSFRPARVAAPPAPTPERRDDKKSLPPAPSFDNLLGIWQGTAPLPVGMCGLKFELRKKTDDPSHFSGFPVLACVPVMATLPGQMGPTAQQGVLSRLSPLSATLTGTAVSGSIQFSVDRVIGRTVSGCAFTSFTVTPFGEDQVIAEWKEGDCAEAPQGGQILLRKTGK